MSMQPAIDRLNLRIERLMSDRAIFKSEEKHHLVDMADISIQSFQLSLLVLMLDDATFRKLK